MAAPYWRVEKPLEARTADLSVRYFKSAGKLWIDQRWTEPKTGERRSEFVVLDVWELALFDAVRRVLEDCINDAWWIAEVDPGHGPEH